MLICQSSSCITHIFIVITYFRILVHVNHLIYYGGDEGNRTPVQNTFNMFFYKLSLSIKISQSITPTNRFYTTVVNIQSRGLDIPLLRSPLVHTSYNPWYYHKMHLRSCLKLLLLPNQAASATGLLFLVAFILKFQYIRRLTACLLNIPHVPCRNRYIPR